MENLTQIPQQAGGANSPEDEAKRAQEEQMRRDVMVTVLDTAARERCTFLYPVTVKAYQRRPAVSRIALVSPERSQQIEGILMRMVQSGQLRGRVSENQLIELLDQVCILFVAHRSAHRCTIRWKKLRAPRRQRNQRLWCVFPVLLSYYCALMLETSISEGRISMRMISTFKQFVYLTTYSSRVTTCFLVYPKNLASSQLLI